MKFAMEIFCKKYCREELDANSQRTNPAIKPKGLARNVMNSQSSHKEMFNETKPKFPQVEEKREAADEPTQQNTDSLYLAIPTPVPGVCWTLALVLRRPHGPLGYLGCLQRPRGYSGAGSGPGVGGSLVVGST